MTGEPSSIADALGDGLPPAPDPSRPRGGRFGLWVRTPGGAVAMAFAALATWFVLGQCFPGIVIGIAVANQGDVTAEDVTAKMMAYLPAILATGLVVAVGILIALRRLRWLADDPVPRSTTRRGLRTGAWIAGAFAACILGQVGIQSLLQALGWEFAEQQLVIEMMKDAGIATWVAFVVLAPIGEELLLRRIVFGGILGSTPGTPRRLLAYSVSGLLFAAIHMHLPATPNYLWMALCFAFVYERTGTVWSAIAVHALNNLWGIYALAISP